MFMLQTKFAFIISYFCQVVSFFTTRENKLKKMREFHNALTENAKQQCCNTQDESDSIRVLGVCYETPSSSEVATPTSPLAQSIQKGQTFSK